MKFDKKILIMISLLLVSLLVLISGCESSQKEIIVETSSLIPLDEEILGTSEDILFSCNQNEDCIKVSNGCCNCNSGGSEIAINKKYLENWSHFENIVCVDRDCYQEISTHKSCFSKARCLNKICRLVVNEK